MAAAGVLIVSAYTPGYADLAGRLLWTAERHGHKSFIIPYPSRGSWEANGHVKPSALRYALEVAAGRDLLWVDADAELVAPWTWDLPGGADLAAHVLRRSPQANPELLSGTVLVRHASAERVVSAWQAACDRDAGRWDQRALAEAIATDGLALAELPPECCWIVDTSEEVYGPRRPVVVHYQASRDVRRGRRIP